MNRLYAKADITEWREEFLRHEPTITSEDDVVSLATVGGFKTGQVARMTVAAREMKIAPADILKPNKLLLYGGARQQVASMVASRHSTFETASGKEYDVRDWVGLPGRDENSANGDSNAKETEAIKALGEKPMVASNSKAGIDRATYYLLNVVPGHIFARLKIIAAADGDVEGVADELKALIDEQVGRLVEPSPA